MRTVAELSIETGIDPDRLLDLGGDWIMTMIDVLDKRAKRR